MKTAVKIKDIAAQLGLSRNTVSKALNGQYVPKKTKEKVIRKAQEMNYKSFNNAIPKSKKYRILLLSGKPFHNMNFFVPLVKSIENYCYDNNYDFFEYTYNSAKTSFETIKNYIRSIEADGIIAIECFEESLIDKLLALKMPISFIDFCGHTFEPNNRKFDLINSTDQKSISDFTKTLITRNNFKNFTYIGDYHHCLSFHERYVGMLRGIVRSGLDHNRENDILEDDATFDYGDTVLLGEKIKKLKVFPDCIICSNDFIARRTIIALNQLGYDVPKDVAVVGFDGVSESINFTPRITTFVVNKEFIGEETIRLLVSRINNKNCPTRIVAVEVDLMELDSTNKTI